jgi:excinuclease ABC subunit B
VLHKLVDLYFARNDYELERGTFRLRGDVLEVRPAYEEMVYRIEFFGDEVDSITVIDPLTGEVLERKDAVVIYPASHYVCTRERLERALKSIEQELQEQLAKFRREGKLLEAQRLKQRVHYDLELLRETGYCKGIENYSRHFDGRKPGEPPYTLIDYFPKDFLLIIDESHQTVPQLRAMYEGEMSRKRNLVEFGWRLPSAYDHRPLKFEEFLGRINQCIFMSATPSEWELSVSQQVVEQIVRPTGLLDPEVEVRTTKGQIEDLVGEIKKRVEKGQRVLVTTLTKRTAEDLTAFLTELGIKAHYLHHDIEAIERTEILRDLRLGNYDVLVGINLLREGLDLPEVSLVAILDADKEGFLRSYTSLIQIMGRAARHAEGKVILYADTITESMRKAIEETNRRRRIQEEFNRRHGITPQSVQKPVVDAYLPVPSVMERRATYQVGTGDMGHGAGAIPPLDEIPFVIKRLEKEMLEAAKRLEFERAAELRDQIRHLRQLLYGTSPNDGQQTTQPPNPLKRKRVKRPR